jgi:hypothetical protein
MDLNHVLSAITLPPKAPNDLLFVIIPTIYAYCVSITLVMDDSYKSFKYDKPTRGTYVAMSIRVVVESILASHFGGEIMDDLFERFSKKIEEYLEVENGKYTNIIISMTK